MSAAGSKTHISFPAALPERAREMAAAAASRAARVVLRAAASSRRAARDIYYQEARRRVPLEQRVLAERTLALKDRHRGQPMFLLGTGPSLQKTDLAPLADHLTMGVNSFYRHPVLERWRPTYFAMMDWAIFINGREMDPFFDQVRAALPGETKLFVPSMFVREMRAHAWFPEERTFYVPMDGDFADGPWPSIDLSLLPSTPNAIMFAVALAIHLGASPIVLLGVDHDYLAAPFTHQANDTHFHTGPSWSFSSASTVDNLLDYQHSAAYCLRLWMAHANLRAIAERNGQVILNAAPGSFLDTYERDDLASVLARHPAKETHAP